MEERGGKPQLDTNNLASDYVKVIEKSGAPHSSGDAYMALDVQRSNDKKAEELAKAVFAKDQSKTAAGHQTPLAMYFDNKAEKRADRSDTKEVSRPSTEVPHPMISAPSSENVKQFHVQNIGTDTSMLIEETRQFQIEEINDNTSSVPSLPKSTI